MLHVRVKDINGLICDTDIMAHSTISELKVVIANVSQKPLDCLILIHKGVILDDDRTFLSYDFSGDTILYVSYRKTALKINDTQKIADPNSINNQIQKTQKGSRTPLMSNQSPIRNGFIKIIENNPQLYIDIFLSNPAFKEIIKKNPQVQHILNDPEFIRNHFKALSNSENESQTALSLDRMLTNIESKPGGYHALIKNYEEFANPMQEGALSRSPLFHEKTVIEEEPSEKPSEDPLPSHPFNTFDILSPFFSINPLDKPHQNSIGHRKGQNSPLSPSFLNSQSNILNTLQIPGINSIPPPLHQNSKSLSNSPHNSPIPKSPFFPFNSIKSPQKEKIPKEAQELILQGIQQCIENGLDVMEMPGMEQLNFLLDENKNESKKDALKSELKEKFKTQLKEMSRMGFIDEEKNIEALSASDGKVGQAIDYLLSH
ncbi:hypothetical protein TRFO_20430 [Tritrichomonas foetus]|uniref:UBA domain-containing protein n=1 Tax=Tritrichomonas foetus TaxID=1144522 RepID=A0A1J4KKZ9_9EUKA|nr:hypothetical protein TRFO_20430 [Tritrichomonas foetus]|eukprot:OHT10374.1 hypothetical protein TRFO_20430 [Tritrichomonas foetus]